MRMNQKLYYSFEVRDKNRLVIRRIRKRRSHSLVRQWSDIHYWEMGAAIDHTMTDRANVSQTIELATWNLVMNGAAGNDDKGIIYGTDATAVDISNHDLGAAIAEGTGAGQLSHQGTVFAAPSISGDSCSFTITRSAINGSGATITVKEIGLAFETTTDAGAKYFLAVRDVLPTEIDIPNGGALTVVYTYEVEV